MDTVTAIAALDFGELAKAFTAVYIGVSGVLLGLRAVLAVLEVYAESTITEDDDRAIEVAIRWVDNAQAFLGQWAGRLSLIPARPKR